MYVWIEQFPSEFGLFGGIYAIDEVRVNMDDN